MNTAPVKTTLLKSIVVIVSIVCTASLYAQNTQPPAGGQAAGGQMQTQNGRIAVLDVAKVFELNQKFNSQIEKLKTERDTLRQQLQGEAQQLRTDAQQLQEYKPGSPEYKKLESDLEQRNADLRTRDRQANTDLVNREASIYYGTYREMESAVAQLAGQYNITLVLRYDSSQVDGGNRADVVKALNKTVVFQKDMDLTEMVVNLMTPKNTAGVGQMMK